MPSLSFKKRFAEKVRSGEKLQTIRAPRKYPVKAGDKLYLYTALRTKFSEKLAEAKCSKATGILISETFIVLQEGDISEIFVDTLEGLNKFAVADGFSDWDDMRQFWLDTHGLPFQGVIIKWENVIPA